MAACPVLSPTPAPPMPLPFTPHRCLQNCSVTGRYPSSDADCVNLSANTDCWCTTVNARPAGGQPHSESLYSAQTYSGQGGQDYVGQPYSNAHPDAAPHNAAHPHYGRASARGTSDRRESFFSVPRGFGFTDGRWRAPATTLSPANATAEVRWEGESWPHPNSGAYDCYQTESRANNFVALRTIDPLPRFLFPARGWPPAHGSAPDPSLEERSARPQSSSQAPHSRNSQQGGGRRADVLLVDATAAPPPAGISTGMLYAEFTVGDQRLADVNFTSVAFHELYPDTGMDPWMTVNRWLRAGVNKGGGV